MMLKILTVFLKTSDIIVDPLCDISPSLMHRSATMGRPNVERISENDLPPRDS